MGATAEECAEGLAILRLLRQLGFDIVVTQRPAQLAGDRWIARVVPTRAAPAGEGEGRG